MELVCRPEHLSPVITAMALSKLLGRTTGLASLAESNVPRKPHN